MSDKQAIDVAIVGAGPAGVIALYYARKAGLNTIVVERQDRVGGLWARLPAWQDIQNREEDWTLGDIPISGVTQPAIVENIEAWVTRFELSPFIRLNTPVEAARPIAGGWELQLPGGTLRSRFLISATGVHNRPIIPDLPRTAPGVAEFHSSTLQDPTLLKHQRVVVVGGGASAYDLVDLALANGAAKIVWVYRALKWFAPTLKAKRFASNIRELSKLQMSGEPIDVINRKVDADLRARYSRFGIDALLPDHPFDIERDQLIPGRRGLTGYLDRIDRYESEVVGVEGKELRLGSGLRIQTDVLLWGTGYEIDLSYLRAAGIDGINKPEDLARRCGSLVKSLDAPNLYFLSVGLDSTSATPWHYAHLARSIMSDVTGIASLGSEPILGNLNYIGVPMLLAPADPVHYPADWRDEYRALLETYPNERPMPIPEYRVAPNDQTLGPT